MRYVAHRFLASRTPAAPPLLQHAYEAHRARRRVAVEHYLATRPLPGSPEPIDGAEDIWSALAGRRQRELADDGCGPGVDPEANANHPPTRPDEGEA